MPIIYEDGQTVVQFTGDILCLSFDPGQDRLKNVAFMLFQERRQGKIGEVPEPKEVDDKICMHERPGVVLAADDYRSLDVVIRQMLLLRNQLKNIEDKKKRAALEKTM